MFIAYFTNLNKVFFLTEHVHGTNKNIDFTWIHSWINTGFQAVNGEERIGFFFIHQLTVSLNYFKTYSKPKQ